jgi:hypothetical protein
VTRRSLLGTGLGEMLGTGWLERTMIRRAVRMTGMCLVALAAVGLTARDTGGRWCWRGHLRMSRPVRLSGASRCVCIRPPRRTCSWPAPARVRTAHTGPCRFSWGGDVSGAVLRRSLVAGRRLVGHGNGRGGVGGSAGPARRCDGADDDDGLGGELLLWRSFYGRAGRRVRCRHQGVGGHHLQLRRHGDASGLHRLL